MCDVDGMTSASILTNYLFMLNSHWTQSNVTHIMHEGKQHGLSDVMNMILSDTSLVVCPDSASNDRKQHKILVEKGIKVLCLDHHECDCDSENALIINPQINSYPNKAITGAGVTWQFCKALDRLCEVEPYADNLLDLCAIGMIGDMSNYREVETRAIVSLGLKNLKNPFLVGLANAHAYVIEKRNGLNYLSMAFGVCPWINATCRTGEMKEKQLVFAAMLEQNKDSIVLSSKRGHKGEPVSLVEEAILVAERIKRRQTDAQNEAMAYIEHQIDDNNLLDNAMLFLIDEEGKIDSGVRGLAANKAQAEYQRPTAVLTPVENEDGEIELRGSMRNYSLSVNQDLKSTLESTGLVRVAG